MTAVKDPAQLPWKELGIDVALECTGIFASKEKAAPHLTAASNHRLGKASCPGRRAIVLP